MLSNIAYQHIGLRLVQLSDDLHCPDCDSRNWENTENTGTLYKCCKDCGRRFPVSITVHATIWEAT